MKRVYIIVYAVLLLLPISVGAQTLSNAERRHVNSKVLSLIEEYENVASLYDYEAEHYFETLFEKGPESMVFCDMIGSESYLKTIPVSDYIQQLRTYASTVTTTIKDVRKGTLTYRDGRWHVPVTMKKTFSYIDKDGYMFSVADYHDADIDIRLNLIYDQDSDVCAIESIEGELQSDKRFPEGRFLIVNKSTYESARYMKHFSTLKVGNDAIVFNEFGQAVLPSGKGYVNDIDVEVLMDTLSKGFNYDVVSFGFKQRKARIKLRYGYSPNAFNVQNLPDIFDVKSPAMELGFDFGFAASAGRNSKFGLYTGLGVMQSNLRLQQNTDIAYTYTTAKFNNQQLWDPISVSYAVKSAQESVTYLDVFVPVYFEVEHKAGNHLMISWSLGAKGYYNLGVDQGAQTLSIDAQVPGLSPVSSQELVNTFATGYYQSAPIDVSAFGNIGLDVNLVKRKIYLMLRAGYEYGIMSKYKSDMAPFYQNDSEISYPVVYDAVQNQHIAVHPMINGLEFSRRGWWFSGGIKFKL